MPSEEPKWLSSIPADILFEDEYMAVLRKEPGQKFTIFTDIAFQQPNGDLEEFRPIYDLPKPMSGLLVLPKTAQAKVFLENLYRHGNMRLRLRALCHGNVPDDLLESLKGQTIRNRLKSTEPVTKKVDDMIQDIQIVSRSPSNSADFITTLDMILIPPLACLILRSMFHNYSPYPIVGNATYTKILKSGRNKGLYMSLLEVSFQHPVLENQNVNVRMDEPAKFENTRARELKFWKVREQQRQQDIELAGTDVDEIKISGNRPLAYVLGEKEFFRLRFKINEACLIPRPSSETLVQAALDQLKTRPKDAFVVDLGTGCGNLIVSILAHCPSASGIGVDISAEALKVARTNAKSILGTEDSRVDFLQKDMATLTTLPRPCDILICNPPYLCRSKTAYWEEYQYEPAEALFVDDDYVWYKTIHTIAGDLLCANGVVILECGKGMMERVIEIWNGWKVLDIRKDTRGWDRCLVLTRRCDTTT